MQYAINPFNNQQLRIGPSEFREAVRYYTREVENLTPRNYLVLMFILDRTIGWDKIWEKISVNHITAGITNVQNGFNLSNRTVYRAMNDLLDLGLINSIKLENNYRLISLARYAGFLTDADAKLLDRNAVNLESQLLPLWQNPTDNLAIGE